MEDDVRSALRGLNEERAKVASTKAASLWQGFKAALTPVLKDTAASATAAAAITAAGYGAKKGFDAIHERVMKPRAFRTMVEENPFLKKRNQKDVQRTFNTLYALNPKMAKDPLIAGGFVGKHTERTEVEDMGAYVDPRSASLMADIGGRRKEPVFEAFTARAVKPREPKEGHYWSKQPVQPAGPKKVFMTRNDRRGRR